MTGVPAGLQHLDAGVRADVAGAAGEQDRRHQRLARGRRAAVAGRRSGRCRPRRGSRRTAPRSSPAALRVELARRCRVSIGMNVDSLARTGVAPLAAGDVGDAADDDPVLAAPVVELQRQRGAGLHLDALDLEAGAFLQHRVRAPGTRHRPVQPVGLVAARLQLADDVLDPLQVVAMRDQHRVGRVDDHEVLHADRRDDAVLGVHVGVAGRDGDALALPAVAVLVGADELGHRLPRPDVAPVEGAADDDDLAFASPPSP